MSQMLNTNDFNLEHVILMQEIGTFYLLPTYYYNKYNITKNFYSYISIDNKANVTTYKITKYYAVSCIYNNNNIVPISMYIYNSCI